MKPAFITDFGSNLMMTQEDGTQTPLERYGVWQWGPKGKHEVVEVGNDLQALMDKYHVPAKRVVLIAPPGK